MELNLMLVKYQAMYEELRRHLATIADGEIPNADVEGAPKSLGEAEQAILGMSFVVDQVIGDLLELQFAAVYSEESAE